MQNTSESSFVPSSLLDEKSYKRRIRAWTMYDWANSAYATTILAAVLPVYFSQVAGATLPSEAAATSVWSMGLSISMLIIALLSPILGTISDISRNKKRFLAFFILIGAISTALLVLVTTGDWLLASGLFIVSRIGFTGSTVFYDALLPHVARPGDEDDISARGYALGYLGGGLLLAINVLMIQTIPNFISNAGSRLSFLSVGIWWLVFSLPVLMRIGEPPAASIALEKGQTPFTASFRQLKKTFGDISHYKDLFKFLFAFLIYNDGIGTIIGVAAIYGAELGFGTIELILALLLVQFVGIPFSLMFGRLPDATNTRRPFFLAFIVFNMLALPLVGVGASRLLPADISGAERAPYEAIGEGVGQGSFDIDSGVFTPSGQWQETIVSARDLSGTGFVAFVNRFFGDEITDATYLQTEELGASVDFTFNGKDVELTYSVGPDRGAWQVLLDGAPLIDADGAEVVIDASNDTLRYGDRTTLEVPSEGLHTLTLVNAAPAGSVMSLAGVDVHEPARQNQLGIIIGLVLAVEVIGLALAFFTGKAFYRLANKVFNLDEKLDTKRGIMLALIIYTLVAIWGYFLNSTVEFWFLAWMVAVVQGGSQALSRSLYSAMSPAAKSGEFFGLFGIMEKFSSMLGPLFFAAAGAIFGSSRPAILSLILFFFFGIFMLMKVDVEAGKAVARAEDAALISAD